MNFNECTNLIALLNLCKVNNDNMTALEGFEYVNLLGIICNQSLT